MELSIEEIDGITDPIENAFAKLALSQDLVVCDSEMITLKREKRGKSDKRSTSPDFLLKRDPSDLGIYIRLQRKIYVQENLDNSMLCRKQDYQIDMYRLLTMIF